MLPSYKIILEHDVIAFENAVWTAYAMLARPEDYLGVYIHVPYCTSHCAYCPFYATELPVSGIPEKDITDIIDQVKRLGDALMGTPVVNVVFGGGSPSTLSPSQLDRLCTAISQNLNITQISTDEKSFEANPVHITEEHIDVLKRSFFNRVSFGVQTLSPEIAEAEDRAYVSIDDCIYLQEQLRDNVLEINFDLLLGLHNQTYEDVERDVRAFLDNDLMRVQIYEWIKVSGKKARNRMTSKQQQEILQRLYETMYPYYAERYVHLGAPKLDHGSPNDHSIFLHRKRSSDGFIRSYAPNPILGNNNVIGLCLGASRLIENPNINNPVSSFLYPMNITYRYLPHNTRVVSDLLEKAIRAPTPHQIGQQEALIRAAERRWDMLQPCIHNM